ncbi:MAG: hypothetical protein AAF578_01395 [Pseudomonadota bacterium]
MTYRKTPFVLFLLLTVSVLAVYLTNEGKSIQSADSKEVAAGDIQKDLASKVTGVRDAVQYSNTGPGMERTAFSVMNLEVASQGAKSFYEKLMAEREAGSEQASFQIALLLSHCRRAHSTRDTPVAERISKSRRPLSPQISNELLRLEADCHDLVKSHYWGNSLTLIERQISSLLEEAAEGGNQFARVVIAERQVDSIESEEMRDQLKGYIYEALISDDPALMAFAAQSAYLSWLSDEDSYAVASIACEKSPTCNRSDYPYPYNCVLFSDDCSVDSTIVERFEAILSPESILAGKERKNEILLQLQNNSENSSVEFSWIEVY